MVRRPWVAESYAAAGSLFHGRRKPNTRPRRPRRRREEEKERQPRAPEVRSRSGTCGRGSPASTSAGRGGGFCSLRDSFGPGAGPASRGRRLGEPQGARGRLAQCVFGMAPEATAARPNGPGLDRTPRPPSPGGSSSPQTSADVLARSGARREDPFDSVGPQMLSPVLRANRLDRISRGGVRRDVLVGTALRPGDAAASAAATASRAGFTRR